MLALENHTRYSAAIVPCWNEQGHEIALTLIKATYRCDAAGTLALDDTQAPIRFADEYFGEPGQSSVRFESDLAFFKPEADVIINGSAHAPRGRRVDRLEVLARVGSASKRLLVTGDRSRGMGSAAAPFESMPIRYEHAAGSDQSNPVGRYERSPRPESRDLLPNIESSEGSKGGRGGRAGPAGLGAIARTWWPRATYAGTYDNKWQEERMPFLPLDFDRRFFQAAADGMTIPYPVGGEPVELVNLTDEGVLRFALQVPSILLLATHDHGRSALSPVPDTVLIEPDDRRCEVTLRAAIPCAGDALRLREVIVMQPNEGVKRAFSRGKRVLRRASDHL